MRLVIIESPHGDDDPAVIARNEQYGRACMRDCLDRGEAPFASHLLYTQPGVLDDTGHAERAIGIAAGLLWGRCADATVVYTNHGISAGMMLGIRSAEAMGRPVEYRTLPSE